MLDAAKLQAVHCGYAYIENLGIGFVWAVLPLQPDCRKTEKGRKEYYEGHNSWSLF